MVTFASTTVILTDFQSRSLRSDIDWIGVGLAFLVRRDLTQLDGVEVAADRKLRADAVAGDADWTVTGEVNDGGEKFVVSVQLNHGSQAGDQRQLLTEGGTQDLFAMADYLAERVAHHLGHDFSPTERARFGRGLTRDVNAFRAFAEALIERRVRAKIDDYTRAVTLDPNFADAHHHLSRIHVIARDYAAAERSLARVIQILPDAADGYNDYAYVLAQLGRFEEAAKHYQRAVDLDPASVRYVLNLADIQAYLKLNDAAIASYRKALALSSGEEAAIAGLERLGVAAPPRVAAVTQPPTGRDPGVKPAAKPEAKRDDKSSLTPRPTVTPKPAATPPPPPAQTPVPIAPVAVATLRPTPVPTPKPEVRAQPTPVPTPSESPRPSATSTRVTVLPKAQAPAAGGLSKRAEQELKLAGDSVNALPAAKRPEAQAHVDAAQAAFAEGREASGYFELGKLYLTLRLGHAAVDLLEKAVSLDAASVEGHKALGDAYMLIGKTRQAHEQYAIK